MPPLAAVPDLEQELDALYALPLEEFTMARNDLVARLRKAHQGEAADEVRALRKPSVVAWTANRLSHAHPDLMGELLEAGARLRQVQQRALAGREERADVAEATGRERDSVRALVAAARTDLGARATPQLLDRLTQTLRAAALDPDASAVLAAGRLDHELRAVGFGPLEAVALRPARPRRDDAAARRARLAQLRDDARRLAEAAREAERSAETAGREAKRLRHEADERRGEADAAAAALAEAEADAP